MPGHALRDGRRLSAAQRSLLSTMQNSDYGDVCIVGRDRRTFNVLCRHGLALPCDGRWGRITTRGRIVFLTWLANEDVPEALNAQRALASLVSGS